MRLWELLGDEQARELFGITPLPAALSVPLASSHSVAQPSLNVSALPQIQLPSSTT